jgi:hypothetical protein
MDSKKDIFDTSYFEKELIFKGGILYVMLSFMFWMKEDLYGDTKLNLFSLGLIFIFSKDEE